MVAIVAVAGTAGCGREAVADPGPEIIQRSWPAAMAGGACALLDYAAVESAIGTRFEASAAATSAETGTCALTVRDSTYPDLVLAITPSEVDKFSFATAMAPLGSATVPKLGQAAYRIVVPARDDAGPQVEIGWLSANRRLMVLRYTFPPEAAPADANGLVGKMIELATALDQRPTG